MGHQNYNLHMTSKISGTVLHTPLNNHCTHNNGGSVWKNNNKKRNCQQKMQIEK
jgi:hypothetical protein